MFFKRKRKEEDSLFIEMREALTMYSSAVEAYHLHLEQEHDAGSAYAQMLASQVHMHRERYLHLRVQYEKEKGTVHDYLARIESLPSWIERSHIQCLFHQKLDPYLKSTFLASVPMKA